VLLHYLTLLFFCFLSLQWCFALYFSEFCGLAVVSLLWSWYSFFAILHQPIFFFTVNFLSVDTINNQNLLQITLLFMFVNLPLKQTYHTG